MAGEAETSLMASMNEIAQLALQIIFWDSQSKSEAGVAVGWPTVVCVIASGMKIRSRYHSGNVFTLNLVFAFLCFPF